MRYIITMVWSCIFCEVIGFIAASLTQMQFNPMQSLIIGAVFGLLFAIIIPAITAKTRVSTTNFNWTKFEYFKKLFRNETAFLVP